MRIDERLEQMRERLEAQRSGCLRATLKDGSVVVVKVADAIPLWLDHKLAHIEPVGSMEGHGVLWELLAGLVEEENTDGQDR